MEFRIRKVFGFKHSWKIQFKDNYLSFFWHDTDKFYLTFDEAYDSMEELIATYYKKYWRSYR